MELIRRCLLENPGNPESAVFWVGHNLFLSGEIENLNFILHTFQEKCVLTVVGFSLRGKFYLGTIFYFSFK